MLTASQMLMMNWVVFIIFLILTISYLDLLMTKPKKCKLYKMVTI